MLRRKLDRVRLLIRQQGVMRTAIYYIGKKAREKSFLEKVRSYHICSEEMLKVQREAAFSNSPRISIITPLYNTPQRFLEELLVSVKNQTYKNWELCLADGSDEEHEYVGKICKEYAEQDGRIRYRKLEQNLGIVGNTNRCIEHSTGEYIGLLDHDDLLHPSALYEVVVKIQRGADFIYTDELKFRDNIGDSTDIVCKSGFGKDELRSHNYICHFVVFQKRLLEGMERVYRQECEGSQDYDMVLRLTEKAQKIAHIPKLLYYWRVHRGSVSMDLSVKQYAVDAAKRAISDQLFRQEEPGRVSSNLPYQTIYKVDYVRKETPLVMIALWGEGSQQLFLDQTKKILKKTQYRPLEIAVPYPIEKITEFFEMVSFVCVEKKAREGRYEWLNRVSSQTKGEYFVHCNIRCIPETDNWIEELLMFAQRQDVCAVGPQINHKKQRIYFAGGVLDGKKESGIHVLNVGRLQNEEGYEANLKHVKNTTFLSSLCMMLSRRKMLEFSGYRPETGDYGDIDLCLRGREENNWNVWTCFAQMKYEGKEQVYAHWSQKGKFGEIWKEKLSKQDEYYHPFLKQLGKL